MLIGGLVDLHQDLSYRRRSESNGPEMSFESAVGAVHSNTLPSMVLMGHAAEALRWSPKVDALKGVEQ